MQERQKRTGSWSCHNPQLTCDIDDRPSLLRVLRQSILFNHNAQCSPGHEPCAFVVDVGDAIEHFNWCLGRPQRFSKDSGTVHSIVDAPKLVDACPHKAVDEGLIRHVACCSVYFCARIELPDGIGGLLEGFGVDISNKKSSAAGPNEGLGYGSADTCPALNL